MDDLEQQEASFTDDQLDSFQRLLLSYIQRVGESYPLDELLQLKVKNLAQLVGERKRKA